MTIALLLLAVMPCDATTLPKLLACPGFGFELRTSPGKFKEQLQSYDTPKGKKWLVSILDDKSRFSEWDNVLEVLAVIGDNAAVDSLIKFYDGGWQDRFTIYFRPCKTLLVLGEIAGRTKNRGAVDYLIKGLSVENWLTRIPPPHDPRLRGSLHDNDVLYSWRGLVAAGHKVAP